MDENIRPSVVSVWRQVLAAFISSISALTCGITLGYTSATDEPLRSSGMLNDDQASWFSSCVILGAGVGGILAVPLVDFLGRKATILCTCIPLVFGWAIIAAADSFPMLILGRTLGGVGIGTSMTISRIYIVEISSHHLRGTLSAVYSVLTNLGTVLAFSVGFLISWRTLALMAAAFVALQSILMLPIPESPRWLIRKGHPKLAQRSLQWLRGRHADIMLEYSDMLIMHESNTEPFSLKEIKMPSFYRPAFMTILLMMCQQAGGNIVVIFYAAAIFQRAGWRGEEQVPTFTVGVAQFVGCILGLVLIDRVGRKPLMLVTAVLMSLTSLSMCVAYFLLEVDQKSGIGWLSLVSLVGYVFASSTGMVTVPSIVVAEILPGRYRGIMSGVALTILCITGFVLTKEFENLAGAIHDYGAFWFLTGMNILSVILIGVFIPETKGRSLEEIEERFVSQDG